MQTVVIVINLMLVLGLIAVVLLQKSEGGGLVSSTSGFMTGRGTANVLTRTTALLAVGFFITSLALSWLAGAEWEGTAQQAKLVVPVLADELDAAEGVGSMAGSRLWSKYEKAKAEASHG